LVASVIILIQFYHAKLQGIYAGRLKYVPQTTSKYDMKTRCRHIVHITLLVIPQRYCVVLSVDMWDSFDYRAAQSLAREIEALGRR
jgi:hypothetical protein